MAEAEDTETPTTPAPKASERALRLVAHPFVSELLVGLLLAGGAAGFSYAFIKRAFLTHKDPEIEDAAGSSLSLAATTVSPSSESSQAARLPPTNVYPLPDSTVIGDGNDPPSNHLGYTSTLVGWGFPANGLLEIREDVPGARAHFYPLKNQSLERTKLLAGRRYAWRVLSSADGNSRQETLAGPYRFTLQGGP